MNLISAFLRLQTRQYFFGTWFIILLLLVTGVGNFAKAQQYIPFPDSLAAWKTIEYGQQPGWPTPFSNEIYLFQKGDTIIGDSVYHKIYQSGNIIYNTSLAQYLGGLRETNDRKVYFLDKSLPSETLLYDFNWQPGDTVVLNARMLLQPGFW
jgi:hypothetical protein